VITIGIYLPMLTWLFCWIGMKVKSQTKAILSSLGAIIIWCLLPFILVFPVFVLNPSFDERSVIYGIFLGPASYVVLNEVAEYQNFGTTWLPLIVNTLIYSGCYYLFRSQCLNHIDKNLGRLGGQEADDHRPTMLPLSNQSILSFRFMNQYLVKTKSDKQALSPTDRGCLCRDRVLVSVSCICP